MLAAMAAKCSETILQSDNVQTTTELPKALQTKHLLWMCQQVVVHAEMASLTKLHRWIGFVQGGMMANHILDLDAAKVMFDEAKTKYGARDDDLLDHLNPESSFKFEIGGEA
jgi:hypothetical protein